MSGRRSKKNQKLGSSRRGARGLTVHEEKDIDECEDGKNEVITDNQFLQAQPDHPSLSIDHQTSELECSPHAGSLIHKDSEAEAVLPERKRKMGSTRKKADGFKNMRKLGIRDEVETTEEFGEEQVTSAIEEEHISFAEDKWSNLHEHSASLNVSSFKLSQQTQRSEVGGELGVPQNIMVTVSQSKENKAIDHQEVTLDIQTTGPASYDDSRGQEIQQASTPGHKRKMGSTRKPLAGNRGKNVEVRELLRTTPGDIWETEVKSSSEAEFSMLTEMMQTWDDVKRKDSPTNTSSHTESAFPLNQTLSSERVEEPEVSAELACSVVDPTKPLLLNKLGSETNNVTTSSQSDNHALNTDLDQESDLSDSYQDVPRHDTNTSEDRRSDELAETKEEPCKNDSKIISLPKHDDEFLASNKEPLSSLFHLDGATEDKHYEIDRRSSEMLKFDIIHIEPKVTDSISEMSYTGPGSLEDGEKKRLIESSTIGQSIAMEEDATQCKRMELKEESLNVQAAKDFIEQGIEIQSEVQQGNTRTGVNKTNVSDSSLCANYNLPNVLPVMGHLHNTSVNLNSLSPEDCKPSCDVMIEIAVCSQPNNPIINNNNLAVSFPEAKDATESQEIYVATEEENDIYDVTETSITCDVTLTEIGMDVKDFTEQGADLQNLAMEENESVGDKTVSETDAFETTDEDNVKDDNMDPRYNEVEDGKSYEFFQDMSEENAEEEVIVKAKRLAFDREDENRKFKVMKDFKESEGHEMDASNDIKPDLQTETHSSDINLEVFHASENAGNISGGTDSGLVLQDTVSECFLELNTVSEHNEINIIPQEEDLNHKQKMATSLEKDAGPVEVLDSDALMTLSSETFIAESICDTTESQNLTKSHAESQEIAGDVESAPVEGDTTPHLEIQTDIEMFDATIVERAKEENVCDVNVLMKQVEFVEDTVTVESNMTTESDFLQNNTYTDTNQEVLKASENIENISAVNDTESPLESTTVPKKNKISIIQEDSQGEDSHSKLSPVPHKRKMGSTRRPLRGNKEKEQDFKEKEKDAKEEDTKSHSETQDQNNVFDHMMQKTMDVGHTEEVEETSETVRMAQQELCEHPSENKERHTDVTLEQEQKSASDISQTQDGPPQVDTGRMLESKREIGKENKDIETENDEATKSEEIFSHEDVNSEITVTSHTHQQLFIQTPDAEVHDIVQRGTDVYEESEGEETFLTANTEHAALDRRNETKDFKVTEEAQHLNNVNVQDNDSQSDLQTENPEQNIILTEEENDKSSDMNLEELQQTEHGKNISADSTLSFGDVVSADSEESHTVCENISEDSQKHKMQSKLNPLVHKRKMGSTRRPLKGNTEQRKHRDGSEILNSEGLFNEEKEQERGIHLEKDAGPVEVLGSALMPSSCSSHLMSEESTAVSQENAGDVESAPVEGDTNPQLDQTEIEMFDTMIVERAKEENVCDVNVLMKQVEFVEDTVTVESNMTTESDFLQNNTSTLTNQEVLKASENIENISAVNDTESPLESTTVPKKNKISIIQEDSQGEDSHSKLSPVPHKRKMGSTRRPLRGNKEKEQDFKEKEKDAKEEDTKSHSETQDQNNVFDHMMQKTMDVGHTEEVEETSETGRMAQQELCEHPSENKERHTDVTLEQEQKSASDISQTQDGPPQVDTGRMLESKREIGKENKDIETENDEATKSEEIFSHEDVNSEITVTSHTHQQLFIQTPDAEVHDIVQRGTDVYEESEGEETFLTANTEHAALDRRNETEDFKVTEEAQHLNNVNVQDNDSQSDLQTENPEQNIILTEEENDKSSDMNLEELQQTEHGKNISADSTLSFGDVVSADSEESHTVCENISEDSQKHKMQSKLNPLVHKRKMGSTRRPLKGNTEQRKHRDGSEILNSEGLFNEEKEQERGIHLEKDAGPVEVLGSALMPSSCSSHLMSEESTAESQKNAGDVESAPVEGDTNPQLDQTEIEMFDTMIVDRAKEENVCDVNVLMKQVEFVEDTVTVESNMTTESDFLQNNTSTLTNQEVLKASENIENISAVNDTESPLESTTVPKKNKISIIQEDSQGDDSHSKLSPVPHKRKMGSTRRPLRGNKEKEQDFKEKEKDAKEEDTKSHSETQDQNNVFDHMMQKTMDVGHTEEVEETSETGRMAQQELCEHPSENKERHTDVTLKQEQKSASDISQTQDGPPQVDTGRMLESKREVGKENKDIETENDEATKSEEIFSHEDVNSEITVTSHTHQQLFIQTSDAEVHDIIQRGTDVYEESKGEETFLSANTEHAALDRRNETEDFKETEEAQHLTNVNVQDNDSQSNLQTENPEQNIVLTEEENDKSSDMNLEELQQTEHGENISSDSTLSFGDVVTADSEESHTVCENISEDSQKHKMQSKLNPLVHKRKMGSTRRPLKGNTEQRKHRDDSEILNSEGLFNEEKEQEREIHLEKDAGPVKVLGSALMPSSCSSHLMSEESTAVSQENAGDVESAPVEGDTNPQLDQTEIEMFDTMIVERAKEENVCDVNVLMKQVEFVEDTVTVESNMTTESDFLQNNTSTLTNQEVLKASENIENISAVNDTESPLESTTVPKKNKISIIQEDSQGDDSHSKLSPVPHKRKMGSTRRPLRGNKEKEQDFKEKEKDAKEEDTKSHSETQDQNNVFDHMMQKTMDVGHTEEVEETSETGRMAQQELCEHPSENKERHTDVTLEQEQKSASDISQTQDGPPQVDTGRMLESKREIGKENKDIETENDEATKSEEIFSHEDVNSEITVTSHTHQQLFIQTSDAEVHDIIQRGTDVYEESKGEETFLSANTEHAALDRRNETEDFKETEEAQHLTNVNVQDNDSQSNLQTENPEQNIVLTEEENDKSSDMNLEELQQTEHGENISSDSTLSFGDVVTADSEESHTVCENISEDSQKHKMQSKLNPLVHKRKMGSTRRPLKGNTEQRKHRDGSEILNSEGLFNEEKEQEREIHLEKDAGPVEVLGSALMPSSCSSHLMSEESTAVSQENAGDVESAPVEGDTNPQLDQTEIEMFDTMIVERAKEENVCDVNVLMKQVEFVEDTVTVESNMTTESDFLQNNTYTVTNQEVLKASENIENISAVNDTESPLESTTVPKKNKIRIIQEDSQGEDSHSKLSPVAHKRKMGSTRRPLRGNKEKEQDFKVKEKKSMDEDRDPHPKVQDQNNIVGHKIKIEKTVDVGHNEEKDTLEVCEHLSENKEMTLEQEQISSPNVYQTRTEPSQDDADHSLQDVKESTSEFKDNPLVLSDALSMEENQIYVSSKPVVTAERPQTEGGEIHSVSRKTLQKRKMGSTRKTERGRQMENERKGEMDEETTKENFTLKEEMSLTITETLVHQQPFSLDPDIEGHDIQDTGKKSDEKTEQAKILITEQNDPNSNSNQGSCDVSEYDDNTIVSNLSLGDVEKHTVPYQSEIIISGESHKEDIQSKLNPVPQKRKMGSTRKTLGGKNGRRRREIESKMDGDSETAEEHPTEAHLATSKGDSKWKSDENTEFKEPTRFEKVTRPETTLKIFSEPEDGVINVINDQSNEVPSASSITDLESEMLIAGENDSLDCSEPSGSSEPEKSDKSRMSLEVESVAFQIDELSVSEKSHQVQSEKHPQSENITMEKRRKMGSTRKNFRGKREEKKREESEGTDEIINDNLEQSEVSLLHEIDRELNTSQSTQNIDYQLIINEPNSGDLLNTPVETSYLINTPENSKPEHDKDEHPSLQVTKSQHSEISSELSSPGRRRKMGSTRKNPRHQVKGEDEDNNDEMTEKNKQGLKVSKKDLEAAEEFKVCDITNDEGNKEYLDVPITLTSTRQPEESAVAQDSTSPSTKRKFGSRRTNMSGRGRSGLVTEEEEHKPDSSEVQDNLHSDVIMVHDSHLSLRTENQPIINKNMEARSEEPVPCAPIKQAYTGASLVSLDQIIKADKSPGKTQTADLKNFSDMEDVQFNVVMVGNSCVGKTSFIRRLHVGQFSPDYCSTIGVDTCVQNVVLHDRNVKLHIWDTAGQERFHSITTQVFHRADGLLLMYEITSSKSFISVRDWITQIQEKAPDDVIMMLLGNKNDCAEREVQVRDGEALAKEYNISFMECSAATGENVSECMKSLAELLVQRKRLKMEKLTVLKREQSQKKSGCC